MSNSASTLANQIAAVERLTARVLGTEIASAFRFEALPDSPTRDTYELDSIDGKISIRGNSGPALAVGLNAYLNETAGAHISWYGSHIGVLKTGAPNPQPVRRESWAERRYFLNYCCYSYSLAYWDWEQWEPFIDWMALRGINLPLAVTGQEAVWQRVGARLGLTPGEVREFLPGAAFLPFGWMGCLDGWSGPLSDHWIREHEVLGQRILERQRELGMTPVLQGFTGHVPTALRRLHPEAKLQTVRWLEWETTLLDPLDPLFSKIATIFLEEQERSFGTNHYYAADTFIEMIPPSGKSDYLAQLGRAIYEGLSQHDPNAVWVLQGWPFHFHKNFWSQDRLQALLDSVPNERMLLLDLFCEARPMWSETDAFCGKPWLWCNIQSFGRNVVLTGAFDANNSGLQAARQNPLTSQLAGIGMVNEGLCHNPVAFDFLFEQAWRETPVDLENWGRGYATHRYGQNHSAASEAWEILSTHSYRSFRVEESGLVRCPTWPAQIQSIEETDSLVRAWAKLISAAPELWDQETYIFDLVHVGRQVLSNRGNLLKKELHEAISLHNRIRITEVADRIRRLLNDLACLLSTHPEFRLTPWVKAAEKWGTSDAERRLLREGALRQITLWGNGDESLRDYARKEWAGLIESFYLPRWEAWFAFAAEAIQQNRTPDEAAFRQQSMEWERSWIETAIVADPLAPDVISFSQKLYSEYAV